MADSTTTSRLRAAGDATVVSIGYNDEWVDGDGFKHFARPDEVVAAVRRRGPSWKHVDGLTLQCELEQFAAAHAIGVAASDMTFRVRWRRSKPAGSFTRRWFGSDPELIVRHTGPKLAIASIYAAASVPTPFDLRRLDDFGYRDIAHVAERIEIWNSSNELQLPRPASA